MHVWRVTSPRPDRYRHELSSGFGHAVLAPVVAHVFTRLRIAATVYDGNFWWAIHSEPSVALFEAEHGLDTARHAYNARLFARVAREKKLVRGEHAGHSDLFVPILVGGEVAAVLVVGPFATAAPESASVLSRWRALTGRQGHPADPEFAAYLATTLATLVLVGEEVRTFERLLGCLACLMSGEGDAEAIVNEAEALHAALKPVRFPERCWEAVGTMVDERSTRTWSSLGHAYELGQLGLSRTADRVLVGLAVKRGAGRDPVDEAIGRDAFQRAAARLGQRVGDAMAGRVGDHGVVFVLSSGGSTRHRQERLRDVAAKVDRLALGFGLAVHFGASIAPGSATVSRTYQAALAAAESALAQGTDLVMAEPERTRPRASLRHLRRELGRAVEEHPERLCARMELYLEAVAAQCGHRMDWARGYLEAGFERMTEPLVDTGALDAKSYEELCEMLDRNAGEARTLEGLLAAYRRATADVANAVERPGSARRDRSLQRALSYIEQHYAEPLRLSRVAREAGFARAHFSQLFKQRENRTFAEHVAALRIDRARHLLASTSVPIQRVAELSGFRSPQYFCRAFRKAVGASPRSFRERPSKKTSRNGTKYKSSGSARR